jgi:hypothetical protein
VVAGAIFFVSIMRLPAHLERLITSYALGPAEVHYLR